MCNLAKKAIESGHSTKILVSGKLVAPNDIPYLLLNDHVSYSRISLKLKILQKCRKLMCAVFFSRTLRNKILKSVWIKEFTRKKREIFDVIKKEKPRIVFVYGDRHGGYEPALLKICYDLDIPTVIPPIAFASGEENLLKSSRVGNKTKKVLCVTSNFNFKNRYPDQWRHDYLTGEDVTNYPDWQVEVMDEYGVLSSCPWTLGCGKSSIIQAEGVEARNRFIKNGVPPEKIKVTGHSEHDNLLKVFLNKKEKRSKLINKYDLENLPILIISLPQLWEHNLLSESEHFILQEKLCSDSVMLNCNVLLSLHPKMLKNNYLYLEEKYKVTIIEERLNEVLPIADLYIVGQGSTTIPWAILCEVPLVILDWYGLNYKCYDWINGKVVVKKQKDFYQTIKTLTDSKEELNVMKSLHSSQKHLASPFDGHCTKRILNFV